jgi:hypothetical protein
MMFDDIHWIDPSSRELLDRMIERVTDSLVLVLAMFRPEFQPTWTGQPHVTPLALPRLDRRNTVAPGVTTFPNVNALPVANGSPSGTFTVGASVNRPRLRHRR